jgi:hypothetical protein
MQHKAALRLHGPAQQHEVVRQLDRLLDPQPRQQARHRQPLDRPVHRQPHGVLFVVGADHQDRALEARVLDPRHGDQHAPGEEAGRAGGPVLVKVSRAPGEEAGRSGGPVRIAVRHESDDRRLRCRLQGA